MRLYSPKNPSLVLTGLIVTLSLSLPLHGLAELSDRLKAQAKFQITLEDFLKSQDREAARKGFQEAIRIDPSYAQPRYNLALLAEADERWDEAVKWLREFLKLTKDEAYAAKAELELQRLARVIELDRTAEGRNRRRYDEQLEKAKALASAGFVKEALRELASASQIDDSRWEAYALGGSILAEQRQFDSAASFLTKAIQRAPIDRRPNLQLALEHAAREKDYDLHGSAGAKALEAQDYARAADEFKKAWTLYPARGEYALGAGTSLAMLGRYPEAAEVFAQLDDNPDGVTSRKAREMLGKLIHRVGRPAGSPASKRLNDEGTKRLNENRVPEAIESFQKAVSLEPFNSTMRGNLGIALFSAGKASDAIPQLKLATRMRPTEWLYWEYLGAALNREERYAGAVDAFTYALSGTQKTPSAYQGRGTAYVGLGQYERGMQDYNEAMKIKSSSSLLSSRGNAHMKLGETRKAIHDFDEALRLNSGDVNTLYLRGWAYLLDGQAEQAVRDARSFVPQKGWQSSLPLYASLIGYFGSAKGQNVDEAKSFINEAASRTSTSWPSPLIRYLRGEVSEEELYSTATSTPRLTEAKACIGLSQLYLGNKKEAMKRLLWVKGNGDRSLNLYDLALKELRANE